MQCACWLSFVAILVATRDPIGDGYLYGIFPRLSLHLGIATSLASRQFLSAFLPALAVLALSLGIGRFFCSTVCPLGASIDACDRIVARRKDGIKPETARARRGLKYLTLAGSLLLALAGVQAAGIIDPLSLSLRGTPRSYIRSSTIQSNWYLTDFYRSRSRRRRAHCTALWLTRSSISTRYPFTIPGACCFFSFPYFFSRCPPAVSGVGYLCPLGALPLSPVLRDVPPNRRFIQMYQLPSMRARLPHGRNSRPWPRDTAW